MAAVSVTLLGGFKIRTASGETVRLATRKAQALLAYLALRPGEEHPRDKLAAIFWGDRSDAQARDSLRHALTAIRKAFEETGTPAVRARESAVALDGAGVAVDVADFDRLVVSGTPDALERAVVLYRGDLLEGFVLDERPFEEWLVNERERLRELALEALARLLGHQSNAGEIEHAILTAVRLLALDPLQESVYRALMRLYARQGRRGAALRQYQMCVAALQRELGTEPEAETTKLYREIVRRQSGGAPPAAESRTAATDTSGAIRGSGVATGQGGPAGAGADPAIAHAADERRPPEDTTIAAPEIPLHETPLVGRATEIARLRHLFDDAARGFGSVVIITGEPGVGKSRLVAELAAEALARGGHVLLGRCHPSTQILPFGPWVDAFRLGGVMGEMMLDGIEPAWRAELARLFPEATVPGLPASSENPLRLFEAIGRLVQHVAGTRPTVVVLEDCHWADEMTLSLVAFVARRIAFWPVMLAITIREDETAETPLVQRTLPELRQERVSHVLALSALARADVADLVRAVLGHGVEPRRAERLEKRVWAASEGNAFVALEALRAWGSAVSVDAEAALPLPERVRELVTARLGRVSDTARKLVAVAAVLGRDFDFALLQRAAELSEDDTASGLEELVRRRIVGGVGERFHFTHDRIREVAHGELLPPRRRLIHARVVTALETMYAGQLDAHALALAQHCQEAALWDKGVVYWRRAAAQAAERSALRQAVECLEGALAALDRLPGDRREVVEQSIDVRLDLRAALFAGLSEVDRVRDLLATAAALASEIGDDGRLARILIMQSHYHGIIAGEMARAEACAQRAFAIAESLRAPGLVARAGSLLGRVQHGRSAYRDAIATLTSNIEFIETKATDEDWTLVLPASLGSRIWLSFALADIGRFTEATATADDAVQRVDPQTHPYRRYHAYWARVAVHLERGEHERAVEDMEHMWVALRETDMQQLADNVSGLGGHAHALAGRVTEAVTFLERALAGSARDAFAGHRDLFYLGDAYLRAGRADDALGFGERSLALARRCEQPGREARALWLLGNVHRARGDRAEGETLYRQALALASELGMRPLVAHCHAGLVILYARSDKRAQAEEHAVTATALYAEMRMPYWQREMERQLAATARRSA